MRNARRDDYIIYYKNMVRTRLTTQFSRRLARPRRLQLCCAHTSPIRPRPRRNGRRRLRRIGQRDQLRLCQLRGREDVPEPGTATAGASTPAARTTAARTAVGSTGTAPTTG